MDGCRDQILDTLILISDPIKIQEDQYQDQCLLLTEDLEFEGVSSKVVFVDSTMEVEYVANLSGSHSNMHQSVTLYCDNSGTVASSKEP